MFHVELCLAFPQDSLLASGLSEEMWRKDFRSGMVEKLRVLKIYLPLRGCMGSKFGQRSLNFVKCVSR